MPQQALTRKERFQNIFLASIRIFIPLFASLFVFRFIYNYTHDKYPRNYGPDFWNNRVWFIIHIIAGCLVMILGALQFFPSIRNKSIPYHRMAGKVYIWSSIVSIITLYIILQKCVNCEPGWTSKMFVGTLWFFFTLAAWWTAVNKNIKAHRQFMTRSFVCASYFVIVRLLDTIGDTIIIPFIKDPVVRYVDGDWLAWLVPLFLVEFYQTWWPAIYQQKK